MNVYQSHTQLSCAREKRMHGRKEKKETERVGETNEVRRTIATTTENLKEKNDADDSNGVKSFWITAAIKIHSHTHTRAYCNKSNALRRAVQERERRRLFMRFSLWSQFDCCYLARHAVIILWQSL